MQNERSSRRAFLKVSGALAAATTLNFGKAAFASDTKKWKLAIVMDKSKKTLGFHGMHVAFRSFPDVEVVAHVDGSSDNIEQKLKQTRAKRFYTGIDEMLDKETPDIVMLTSRLPGDHLEQIRRVAEKGCHIYCEKPLTANLEEADEIIRISEEKKIKIGMAHPCRYNLGFVTMKRLVESGRIGVPLTIHAWGKSDHRGGGEDLMTLGTHVLDLMVWFFGAPQCVTADIRTKNEPATVSPLNNTAEDVGPTIGDEIFAVYRFSNAVHGMFESRRGLYTHRDNRMGISVIGSKGQLSCRFSDADWVPQPLRFSNAPCSPAGESFSENIELKEDRIIPGADPADLSLRGQPDVGSSPVFVESGRFAAWDLMQAIEQDRRPVANIYEARTALEMIYGVYASHLAETTIGFPLKDRSHPLKKP